MGVDPGRLRVGRVEPIAGLDVDPECAAAVAITADVLTDRGHDVEPIALTPLERPVIGPWFVSGVARELDRVAEWVGRPLGQTDVEPHTWFLAQMGRSLSATQHLALADACWSWVRELCGLWYGRFDVLLLPVAVSPPPPLGLLAPDAEQGFLSGELARQTRLTMPFDLTGEPAISLPVHQTPGGLPVGAQLVAPLGREDVLFRLAAQVDEALGFESRRPG